ncbi:uncharacterized protein CDAR_303851 [Caerostris darwini]|uniref:EGF-like domain-containing protein n=1 Tax=Caerostris darwini TaxID=1538125 RepID=A0AAV4T3P7_9ARAC|nr:uncharacterized protein CDAR_303851 [Caerostris darwini]
MGNSSLKDICNSNDDCQNDGVCLDKDGKNFCECNPGTEGDHCEIVVDCVTGRYRNCTGERGTCMFDQITRTAVCICPEKKALYHKEYVCKDCYCGEGERSCDFRNGKKVCLCGVGYDENNGFCEMCDCGSSIQCKFINGQKKCECHRGFANYNGFCKRQCDDDSDCQNGGMCKMKGGNQFCKCNAGVTGDRCETIVDCLTGKYKFCSYSGGRCFYDHQRNESACECPKNKSFHYKSSMCKETCRNDSDCENGGLCKVVGGSKFCECKPQMTGDRCEIIYECRRLYSNCSGANGTCYYDHQKEKAVCVCSENRALHPYEGYCKECDCGVYGFCSFKGGDKFCSCSPLTSEKDGKCVECDCGSNGLCVFERGRKKCICSPPAVERDGKCVDCHCGKNSQSCRLDWFGQKMCNCHFGYVQIDGYCTEICNDDKCLHGECEIIGQRHKCKCYEGYTGSRCEKKKESESVLPVSAK